MRLKAFTTFICAGALWISVLPTVVSGQRGGQQVQLPEGAGKELVQTTCAKCHGLNMVTNAPGYSKQEWHDLIGTMIALPKDQADPIETYLATHFPPKAAAKPVVVPGTANVTIKEWLVPTLGSRPHDPLWTPDNALWWTGQYASRLGRVDLKSGDIKEFPLKTPDSQPHGLVNDKDGNIWFTAIAKNYVGKFNPKTGDVTEYPLPANARGPHTPIFDQKGMLWFTIQSGMVGRIDPATGEMKVAAPPSTPTYPYGIVVNSKGVPWYVDFRGNRLASVDPATMTIKEYSLPSADARPRRIAITADDVLWYTDYARGYLGRLDPTTGAVKEWASPSGAASQPYGITAVGNVIWYNESAVRPNTLVRFDTKTEKFQSWVIPSGGGVVRNMMATKDGDLVLACSGVNRVAFVDVK